MALAESNGFGAEGSQLFGALSPSRASTQGLFLSRFQRKQTQGFVSIQNELLHESFPV